MLRSVSDHIDGVGRLGVVCQACAFFSLTILMGEPGRLCVGDRAWSARLVLFLSATHLLYRRGGGCFRAAAGQPHHSITL